MNSRPEMDVRESAEAEKIADYLDHLCAPLLGVAPYPVRRRLRLEAEEHLRALASDFACEGFDPAQAVDAALREYGEPWQIGQTFADGWLNGAAPGPLARWAGAVTLRAFAWFGILTVANLLLIECYALEPSGYVLAPFVTLLALLSPVVAGALTGLGMHARQGRGISRALIFLIADSALTGLMTWPHTEVLFFAGFQLLFWLPVGCLTATVTASFKRHLQRWNYWHAAR